MKQAHAVLSKAIRDAERDLLVVRNVVQFAKKPKVEDPEVDCFDEAQAQTFQESVRGHRLEAIYVLALTHGMRLGELLGLQ